MLQVILVLDPEEEVLQYVTKEVRTRFQQKMKLIERTFYS